MPTARCSRKKAVDVLFAPEAAEIYPPGASTVVEVAGISDRLDGVSRPGHFVGVATVVAKLFNIVQPDHAFFGQKDAAQVAVLRRMVRDLHFNLELVVCPIVREARRTGHEFAQPLFITRATAAGAGAAPRAAASRGATLRREWSIQQPLIDAGLAVLADEPEIRVDYCSIVDPETLEDVPT